VSVDLSHTTVLLHEAVEALQVKPQGIYVDGTFGRGGHSRLILQQLGANGRLIALDKDPAAIEAGRAIDDLRFQLVHSGFEELGGVLRDLSVDKVDGVLLDLGVSSPQLDDAERGFSFRFDAPLDMRMDTSSGQTAAEWLATADESLLVEVIRDYGEELFAKQIARALVAARKEQAILTTRQLSEVVAKVVRTREPGKNPATRTFQAIRIYINRELEELTHILPQCVECLKPGGRLAVISFHSLEDRRVKEAFRDDQRLKNLTNKPIRADEEEVDRNPRSRSAKLRVAERV